MDLGFHLARRAKWHIWGQWDAVVGLQVDIGQ